MWNNSFSRLSLFFVYLLRSSPSRVDGCQIYTVNLTYVPLVSEKDKQSSLKTYESLGEIKHEFFFSFTSSHITCLLTKVLTSSLLWLMNKTVSAPLSISSLSFKMERPIPHPSFMIFKRLWWCQGFVKRSKMLSSSFMCASFGWRSS